VVYASNNKTWIGMLANEPTVERLGAIREHKQFGVDPFPRTQMDSWV
jgi:hypothetical protein